MKKNLVALLGMCVLLLGLSNAFAVMLKNQEPVVTYSATPKSYGVIQPPGKLVKANCNGSTGIQLANCVLSLNMERLNQTKQRVCNQLSNQNAKENCFKLIEKIQQRIDRNISVNCTGENCTTLRKRLKLFYNLSENESLKKLNQSQVREYIFIRIDDVVSGLEEEGKLGNIYILSEELLEELISKLRSIQKDISSGKPLGSVAKDLANIRKQLAAAELIRVNYNNNIFLIKANNTPNTETEIYLTISNNASNSDDAAMKTKPKVKFLTVRYRNIN